MLRSQASWAGCIPLPEHTPFELLLAHFSPKELKVHIAQRVPCDAVKPY